MRKALALTMVLASLSCIGPGPVTNESVATLGPFTDPRAAGGARADRPPPAISGGTLGVTANVIVAADPDRDRVLLVRTSDHRVVELAMPVGSEPTRVAIADGLAPMALVVLRGIGEVATIRLSGGASPTHRWVCDAPRGITYDSARGLARVACQGGDLVSFDPTIDGALSTMTLPFDDLRDVMIDRDTLIVSRFHAAELVQLDLAGNVLRRQTPPIVLNDFGAGGAGTGNGNFVPSVAWRTTIAGGFVWMSHQRSLDATIDVSARTTTPPMVGQPTPSRSNGSPYGGSETSGGGIPRFGACSTAVVQSVLTQFNIDDFSMPNSVQIGPGALPVDVAASSNQAFVVMAGLQRGDVSTNGVRAVQMAQGGCGESAPGAGVDNPIAVAVLPATGTTVVQGRDPSVLMIGGVVIDLGGDSVFDTGHALFHVDAGQGVACASCHPEGGDDGRVWHFSDTGARRTLSLPHGLSSTAPFHWNGELHDMNELMPLVFTERMGGADLDVQHVATVTQWLDQRPTALRASTSAGETDLAIARGRALFEGRAQCAQCHDGPMLTNATTVDVGTGAAFQVPTLRGVSRRLPLMHDGCALTLADRFTANCGGRSHGAQDLTSGEIADLIAYLRTL
jgi:hypothetical protein